MKNGSDCSKVRDELTALLYGELAPAERDTIEAHLAACPPCTRALEELKATEALLAHWDAPRVEEDPQALAAEIRAQAHRTRIPPFVAGVLRVAAAAAVLLFVFVTVLGSELRYADGELTLSLRLAGSDRGTAVATSPSELESTVRRIAAEEVEDWTLAQQEELGRLVAAFDRLRAEDQRVLAGLLDSFRTRNARENGVTRKALVDLASYVTRPQ